MGNQKRKRELFKGEGAHPWLGICMKTIALRGCRRDENAFLIRVLGWY